MTALGPATWALSGFAVVEEGVKVLLLRKLVAVLGTSLPQAEVVMAVPL